MLWSDYFLFGFITFFYRFDWSCPKLLICFVLPSWKKYVAQVIALIDLFIIFLVWWSLSKVDACCMLSSNYFSAYRFFLFYAFCQSDRELLSLLVLVLFFIPILCCVSLSNAVIFGWNGIIIVFLQHKRTAVLRHLGNSFQNQSVYGIFLNFFTLQILKSIRRLILKMLSRSLMLPSQLVFYKGSNFQMMLCHHRFTAHEQELELLLHNYRNRLSHHL